MVHNMQSRIKQATLKMQFLMFLIRVWWWLNEAETCCLFYPAMYVVYGRTVPKKKYLYQNFSSFLKLILNIKQQRHQLGSAGPQHGSVEGSCELINQCG